uniref:Uncharacterized protein n=1 Tax=Arundo donax TaxID=35708 RepID=A0A0A8YXR6_ARUDO
MITGLFGGVEATKSSQRTSPSIRSKFTDLDPTEDGARNFSSALRRW